MTDLSLVIPCYNEAANLPSLLQAVARSIPADFELEVIFVDNGSTDDSARVFAELLPRHPFARGLRIPVNKGYGHGVVSGLHHATGRVLGWTHADLQADPIDVVNGYRAFRDELAGGRVVLKGRRLARPLIDRLFTAGMSVIASFALGQRLTDVNAQPKLFPRPLLDKMSDAPDDFSLDLYLLWVAGANGYRIVEHPVAFGRRTKGEAKGGATLRLKWRLTLRTVSFIRTLQRRVRRGGRR